jgi:carbonic anhydrase/acetyltransferase-like protein (isoleucine patch superfamily)
MPVYALGDAQPRLPDGGRYWIAPDAHVIGRVRLGVDVGIWFGAVLRGDNADIEIGDGSNIQEHAMLHTDPGLTLSVGTGCTVGHHAVLHGCIIGDNSLVGIGATVLNGARIGANCLVGARALVTEGKQFPDGAMILGAPATVKRLLEPAEIEGLRFAALHYVERWRLFAEKLKRLDPA